MERAQALFSQSTDLHVGAPREVDVAVAQSFGDIGEAGRLLFGLPNDWIFLSF